MLFFADNAPKTPYVPIKTQKRINFRPLRTQAKYGAVNGVCAPFFFSAVVTDRIPQGDTFVLSLWGECEHRRRLVAVLLLGGQKPCTHFQKRSTI